MVLDTNENWGIHSRKGESSETDDSHSGMCLIYIYLQLALNSCVCLVVAGAMSCSAICMS